MDYEESGIKAEKEIEEHFSKCPEYPCNEKANSLE